MQPAKIQFQNEAQRIAFEHPCYEAQDTAHERFQFGVQRGERLFSVVLTVNVGFE